MALGKELPIIPLTLAEQELPHIDSLPRAKEQSWAARVVFLLLVGYCVVGATVVTSLSVLQLNNPWENAYFESPQTYAALHAVQTGQLYIPMSQPPYTPQAYTPLYYAIDAAIAWFAHSDIDRFILYGRILSLLCFLACGVCVYLVCRTVAIPQSYSILAGLMLLGQPDFLGWNISPRPDMLFLLAMLLSLLCALKWTDHAWLGAGLAGFLGGIAFLIKQPGIAVVAAIFFVLVLRKQFQKALILAVSALVPVVIVFGILYLRKDPFLQQLSFVRNSLWSFWDTVNFCAFHLRASYWLVPMGIGVIGFRRAIRHGHESKMLASFAAVNWFVGFATLPQIGGYLNYLLPGLAGSALLLPYAVEATKEHSRSIITMFGVGAALLIATNGAYNFTFGIHRYFQPPTKESLTWLRPYRVLSDLTTMNMHGRDPELLDPFGAHVLELTGHWDAKPLIDDLTQGKFDLVIFTRAGIYHVVPSFRGISYLGRVELKALNDNYEPLCSTAWRAVLKPRGRTIPLSPEFLSRELGGECRVSPPGRNIVFGMELGAQ